MKYVVLTRAQARAIERRLWNEYSTRVRAQRGLAAGASLDTYRDGSPAPATTNACVAFRDVDAARAVVLLHADAEVLAALAGVVVNTVDRLPRDIEDSDAFKSEA